MINKLLGVIFIIILLCFYFLFKLGLDKRLYVLNNKLLIFFSWNIKNGIISGSRLSSSLYVFLLGILCNLFSPVENYL